jgi:hypothetical protein
MNGPTMGARPIGIPKPKTRTAITGITKAGPRPSGDFCLTCLRKSIFASHAAFFLSAQNENRQTKQNLSGRFESERPLR